MPHFNSFPDCRSFKSLAGLSGLLLTAAIPQGVHAADSPRMYSPQTGSYYQHFDTAVYWTEANTACQTKGGHLVTITSQVEQDFIKQQFVDQGRAYSWIGASDAETEGVWRWVTGERWNYTYWMDGYPSRPGSADYAVIWGGGRWIDRSNSQVHKYICEWESHFVQDKAEIGDINSDGVAEIGILKLRQGVRTVEFKNPVTNTTVGIRLTFGSATDSQVSYLAPVSDMSRNNRPEVAVMVTIKDTGVKRVLIKDSTNNSVYLKNFAVFSNTQDVLRMTHTTDQSGDGVSELAFLVRDINTARNRLVIYNPVTGRILKTINL
jgi:hypothetical protein